MAPGSKKRLLESKQVQDYAVIVDGYTFAMENLKIQNSSFQQEQVVKETFRMQSLPVSFLAPVALPNMIRTSSKRQDELDVIPEKSFDGDSMAQSLARMSVAQQFSIDLANAESGTLQNNLLNLTSQTEKV